MKARLVKFRLGLRGGRGPEVYSRGSLSSGWLVRQKQPGLFPMCWSGWLSCGEVAGPWANEHASGAEMGGSSVGGKVRRSRGHGLVAVAARVRQTETDGGTRKGNKKGHIKGDIKRKKIEERLVSASGVRMTTRQIYCRHTA